MKTTGKKKRRRLHSTDQREVKGIGYAPASGGSFQVLVTERAAVFSVLLGLGVAVTLLLALLDGVAHEQRLCTQSTQMTKSMSSKLPKTVSKKTMSKTAAAMRGAGSGPLYFASPVSQQGSPRGAASPPGWSASRGDPGIGAAFSMKPDGDDDDEEEEEEEGTLEEAGEEENDDGGEEYNGIYARPRTTPCFGGEQCGL